ncbi:MAG TPA: hypothetical protein VHM70_20405 [Polyangiaceae bacterium]|nr:hypothetical protein [Polyangiaceae bacterium]
MDRFVAGQVNGEDCPRSGRNHSTVGLASGMFRLVSARAPKAGIKGSSRASISTLVTTALTLLVRVGAAQPQSAAAADGTARDIVCMQSRVLLVGSVSASWVEALNADCKELGALENSDSSVTLTVREEAPMLVVQAHQLDGRSTLRRVASADELRLTLEALLLLPPGSSPKDASNAPTSASEPLPNASASAAAVSSSEATPRAAAPAPTPAASPNASSVTPKPASPATPPTPTSTLNPELGLGAELRVTTHPVYAFSGVTAFAATRFDDTLIGVTLRWDFHQFLDQPALPDFRYDAIGVGFVLAKRTRVNPRLNFDWGGQALIMGESQTSSSAMELDADSTGDVRLGALLKANVRLGTIHPYAILDADVSPLRVGRELHIDAELPPLPAWTLGLGCGLSWGSD